MPNPWKEPKALGKLLDIQPGEAREVIQKDRDALSKARAAKREGVDPRTILQTNNQTPAEEVSVTTTTALPPDIDKLQTVKTLYEGYNIRDINAIFECIELFGGVEQFRKAKELLDSLQMGKPKPK